MSGQLDDQTMTRVFRFFMAICEGPFDRFPMALPNDSPILQSFRDLNAQSWLPFYDLPTDKLLEIAFGGLSFPFDILQIQRVEKPSQLALYTSALESVVGNETKLDTEKLLSELQPKVLQTTLALRVITVQFHSILNHKCIVSDLIAETKRGSHDAAVKLVALDSSFLETDYIQRLLRQSELSDDKSFKKRLAYALAHPAIGKQVTGRARDRFALVTLFAIGFADKTNQQRSDFLAREGFSSYSDPRNVAKAIERMGLNKNSPLQARDLDNSL